MTRPDGLRRGEKNPRVRVLLGVLRQDDQAKVPPALDEQPFALGHHAATVAIQPDRAAQITRHPTRRRELEQIKKVLRTTLFVKDRQPHQHVSFWTTPELEAVTVPKRSGLRDRRRIQAAIEQVLKKMAHTRQPEHVAVAPLAKDLRWDIKAQQRGLIASNVALGIQHLLTAQRWRLKRPVHRIPTALLIECMREDE